MLRGLWTWLAFCLDFDITRTTFFSFPLFFCSLQRLDPIFMFSFFFTGSAVLYEYPYLHILLRFDLGFLPPFASEVEEPSLLALNKAWPQIPSNP